MSSGHRNKTISGRCPCPDFPVFHAIGDMSSPSGLPTNALFGFTRDLLLLRTEKRPDYLVCAFDRGEPTVRTDLYKEYKANRGRCPTTCACRLKPSNRCSRPCAFPSWPLSVSRQTT